MVSGQLATQTATITSKLETHHMFNIEVFKETIDRLRFLTARIKLMEEAIGAGYIEGKDVTYQGSLVTDDTWINAHTSA